MRHRSGVPVLVEDVELVALGLGTGGLDVLSCSGLEEGADVGSGKFFGGDEDLEADHEEEGDLVLLEEAPVDVHVDVLGHDLDDELDSLLGGVGLGGLLGEGPVEEVQELLQQELYIQLIRNSSMRVK